MQLELNIRILLFLINVYTISNNIVRSKKIEVKILAKTCFQSNEEEKEIYN